MQRRTFLSLCLGSAAALTGAAAGISPLWRSWLSHSQSAVFPGAIVEISVSSMASAHWYLEITVEHDGESYPSLVTDYKPGATIQGIVPYPHPDLQTGSYRADAVLRNRKGDIVERATIGSYDVRKPVFSA